MPRGGRLDPGGGKQLLALPHPFLQVELSKPRDVFSANVQAEPAERDALLARVPGRVLDPERIEETWPQVLDDRLPRDLLNDRRQHVARRRVVEEECARFVRDGTRQKYLHHAVVRLVRKVLYVIFMVPGRHRQQIADAHGFQIRARFGWRLFWEELQYRVLDAQLPFGNHHAHGRRCEALAEREHLVRFARSVGPPPPLRDHLAMPDEHEAMQRVELLLGLVDESE